MKKITLKIKGKKLTKSGCRFLYLSILALIIIGLIFVIVFIGQSLITGLKYSEKIVVLKQEIASETFDINEFNLALENFAKKTDPGLEINWSEIKNIFLAPGTPQPAQSPSPSPDKAIPR